jgi:hypothetical protein
MALLKRELYRQVEGLEITGADRCTLVFDTDSKKLYVERELAHLGGRTLAARSTTKQPRWILRISAEAVDIPARWNCLISPRCR